MARAYRWPLGFGAALVAMIIGVPIGLAAGYFRGRIDMLLVALIDLFIALPGLVLALIITVMVGPSVRNLVLVLGFVMWPAIARLVRGQALALRETVFVEAARAVGGSHAWIIRRHVWPGILPVVASQFAVSCVSRDLHVGQSEFPWCGHSAARGRLGRHGARRLRLPGDQSADEPGDRAPR